MKSETERLQQLQKCNINFNSEKRAEIHKAFWEIGNIEYQRRYDSSLVESYDKKSKRTTKDKSLLFSTG